MLNIDQKIEYVKIITQDSGANYITAKYKVGEQILSMNVDVDNKTYLKTPQDVILCCITSDALYKAETTLLTSQYSNYMVTFVVKLPEKFEKQQERKFFRVRIDKEAKLSFKENGVLKTYSCRTCDLSAGGVRLILNERPQIADEVTIDIVFDSKTISSQAKLVKLFYNNNIPQASFEFINLSEKDLDYISSVCFKKQLADISSKRKML